MRKKIILMLLFIAATINIIIAQTPITDFEYELMDSDEVCITGYIGNSTHVVIPSEIEGFPVVRLGAVFYGNTTIKSVIIPDSVRRMDNTFEDSNIKSIKLPDSIEIMKKTFKNSAISNIKLSENLREIGIHTFMNTKYLKSIILPDSLEIIGEEAFINSGLTSLTIPDSVEKIDGGAFMFCRSLEKIIFPEQEDGLVPGYQIFLDCENLTTIENVEYLIFRFTYEKYAFSGCKKIKLSIQKTLRDRGYNGGF
ncbi:leucine-rich repeat protein [Treponema putidum]|uniref:leucine-rich repeat domain-containing protein n=1 Tax=Treponema putidum TaxID=221027 RepID=UPI003D8AABF4